MARDWWEEFKSMLIQLALGALLIGVTVGIHAFFLDRFMRSFPKLRAFSQARFRRNWKFALMIKTAMMLTVAHLVEIAIWAAVFVAVGEIGSVEGALYFSIASFTTVGYGDVVLSPDWRLLGSIEAGNGMLLFGWSTAFLFSAMMELWRPGAAMHNASGSGG